MGGKALSEMIVFSTLPITFNQYTKYFQSIFCSFLKCSNTLVTGRKYFCCLHIILYKTMLQQSPPPSKQVYWSSSYFLFFIKHWNPFVKTQTKGCFTQTSLKSMHTIKNIHFFFFVPKLKTWIVLSRLTALSPGSPRIRWAPAAAAGRYFK